jgi:hypothetical protein
LINHSSNGVSVHNNIDKPNSNIIDNPSFKNNITLKNLNMKKGVNLLIISIIEKMKNIVIKWKKENIDNNNNNSYSDNNSNHQLFFKFLYYFSFLFTCFDFYNNNTNSIFIVELSNHSIISLNKDIKLEFIIENSLKNIIKEKEDKSEYSHNYFYNVFNSNLLKQPYDFSYKNLRISLCSSYFNTCSSLITSDLISGNGNSRNYMSSNYPVISSILLSSNLIQERNAKILNDIIYYYNESLVFLNSYTSNSKNASNFNKKNQNKNSVKKVKNSGGKIIERKRAEISYSIPYGDSETSSDSSSDEDFLTNDNNYEKKISTKHHNLNKIKNSYNLKKNKRWKKLLVDSSNSDLNHFLDSEENHKKNIALYETKKGNKKNVDVCFDLSSDDEGEFISSVDPLQISQFINFDKITSNSYSKQVLPLPLNLNNKKFIIKLTSSSVSSFTISSLSFPRNISASVKPPKLPIRSFSSNSPSHPTPELIKIISSFNNKKTTDKKYSFFVNYLLFLLINFFFF